MDRNGASPQVAWTHRGAISTVGASTGDDAVELSEEHRMLRDLVAKFVDRDLMPLEKSVLAREARGEKYGLTEQEEAPLLAKCRDLGLWALDVPEEWGVPTCPPSR